MVDKQVIERIKEGEVFLYPTDTTFGIGCDVTNEQAVQKIFRIKNRQDSKSFIILVESEARLQKLVDVPDLAWDLIDLSEKPISIVYDNPKNLPKELIAEDNSIAIRLTKDLLCKQLISNLNNPIVSTSANLSGEPSPKNYLEISPNIKNEVDFIFPECENFIPKYASSSVIKLSADGRVKVLRP